MNLKMTDLFLEELKGEAVGTRKALERVPEGHYDWRPHPKSMPFGYLASLVATMPRWIDYMINRDELDFAPVGVNKDKPAELRTAAELKREDDHTWIPAGRCSPCATSLSAQRQLIWSSGDPFVRRRTLESDL